MEVIVGHIPHIHGSVIHTHHIREAHIEKAVKHSRSLLQGRGEIGFFLVGHLCDVAEMAVGYYVNAVGIFAEERQKYGEAVVFEDYSSAVLFLLAFHLADKTFAALLLQLGEAVQLKLYFFWNEAVTVYLTVRVGHRYSHRLAFILKDEHEFYLFVGGDGGKSLLPQLHDLHYMLMGKAFHRGGVVGAVKHYLAFAVGRGGLEKVACHVVLFRRVL